MKSHTYSKLGTKLVRTVVETPAALPPKSEQFDIRFLKDSKSSIKAERDAFVVKKNAELAEVQEMLDNAQAFGLMP